MPKKIFRIRKFEGGLNEVSDPKDLEEGQFATVQDVSFDKLGQARTIGSGTEDTAVTPIDGNAITDGHGLCYFSSSYTHRPVSSIAVPTVEIVQSAKDGVKAFGKIKVIAGYLDTSQPVASTPNIKVTWTSTSVGHSAVNVTDEITGWFTSSYILNGEVSGNLKTDTLQTLINGKFAMSSESSPNLTSTPEGVHLKIENNVVGTTEDYDSDAAAEQTAGVLGITSVNSGVNVTLCSQLNETQKNKIMWTPAVSEDLEDLDDDYILLEIAPNIQHGSGDPGWILLYKSDLSGGLPNLASQVKVHIGSSDSELTWLDGFTTTYAFTIYDEASNSSDTTSFTTTGTSYDAASEVAAKLEDDYDDSIHQSITSTVSGRTITLTNPDAGAAHSFSVTARVTHTKGNTETGENYLAYVDPARKLYVFSYDKLGDGSQASWSDHGTITWTDGGMGTGWATDTPKPHIYSADGGLRIVDKDFSSNLINAWYGHCGSGDTIWAGNAQHGGWKTYPQALKFNTADIRTDGQSAVSTPSADTMNISITTGAEDTGYWNNKYKFYVSAVFNDGQESLPDKELGFTSDPILTVGDNVNKSLILDIAVTPDASEPFDNCRITGFSIYYTKEIDGYATYYWLGSIDQTNGWEGADGQTAALSDSGSTAHISAVTIPSDDTPYTYEGRGFASPLNRTIHGYNGTDGLQYKTSCIAKSRLFVGNLKYDGQSHGSEICVTPWRKFDTFPIPYGIITVNNDDADSITHLEAAGDRILQFKENNLYVINVSEIGSETVEASYNYKGASKSYHVCKVEDGIAWINKTGAFMYNINTGDVRDLMFPDKKDTGKRVKTSSWSSFFTDNSILGYDSIRKQLVIKKSITASLTSGNIYLYDFTVDAWSFGFKRFANNKKITNFVTTPNGNMTVLKQGLPGDDFDDGGEEPRR